MNTVMNDLRVLFFLTLLIPAAAGAVDSTFTYQGELTDAGQVVDGVVDLRFRIFDQPADGMQLDEYIAMDVVVDDGRFTTPVTIARSVFDGDERYIEIAVADPAGAPFEPLEPRQRISPAPYALFADDAPLEDPLPTGCAGGQVPVWNGSEWTCGSAGGSITGVVAGDGLSGGGSFGSVTLDVAFAGNGSADMVARSDHHHDDRYYTEDELGQAGQGAAVHWDNLAGVPDPVTSPPGAMPGPGLINQDGVLSIASLPRGGHVDTLVDAAGTVGEDPAIIIGLDGLPLISYYDAGNGDLKVHHCHDMLCTGGTTSVVDSAGIVGEYTSITIGRDGYGMISYYDRTNGDLKLARCTNVSCSTSITSAIDSTGDVGQYTSITVTDNGYAFISYYDVTAGDLKAVRCSTLSCAGNSIWVVDSNGDVGRYLSVIRNPRNTAYISYYDATNGNLNVARCSDMSCSSPQVQVVDGTGDSGGVEDDAGRWTSITTGPDGLPVISHVKAVQPGVSSGSVRVTKCENINCSTATTDGLVFTSSTLNFSNTSITISPYGFPLVSLTWDTSPRVYVVQCGDPACNVSLTNDSAVKNGQPRDMSLTIGADGLPILAYRATTGGDLRVLHCSEISCQPYLRRR